MFNPITISRFARERQQETVDKYVGNKGGGPLEAKMYQIIGALIGLRSQDGEAVASTRIVQACKTKIKETAALNESCGD